MSEEKLMDVDEAAQYVGLSSFTVRRLAKEGALPAAKLGRAYRFKREHIDAFLRENYNKGKSDES